MLVVVEYQTHEHTFQAFKKILQKLHVYRCCARPARPGEQLLNGPQVHIQNLRQISSKVSSGPLKQQDMKKIFPFDDTARRRLVTLL